MPERAEAKRVVLLPDSRRDGANRQNVNKLSSNENQSKGRWLKRTITPGTGRARTIEARIRRFSPVWFSASHAQIEFHNELKSFP